MKKEIKSSKKTHPQKDLDKNTPISDNIMRREAIKRIAYLALGGVTGIALINSCYEDYSDYYDYVYSDYYSDYYYYDDYYDYYSVYSVYWD
jgi:hypothetical protein